MGNDGDDDHFNDDDEVCDDLMIWVWFYEIYGEMYIFAKKNKSACSSYGRGEMVMMMIIYDDDDDEVGDDLMV